MKICENGKEVDPVVAVLGVLAVIAIVVVASLGGCFETPEEEPSLYEQILEEDRIRNHGLWE